MTIVMRGSPAGGDSPQENPQQQQQPQAGPSQPAAPTAVPAPVGPVLEENGQGDANMEGGEEQEPDFPLAELGRLDEMINRPRWVVPVLPKGELEVLLDACIKMCKEGLDTRSEHCQRFFREGLTTSFTKIMTDEAVSGWKYEIHKCILKNAEKMVELAVTKLSQDWFPLLDLLAMVFYPQCKFHTYNSTRPSETVPAGSALPDDALFARPLDPRTPKGWLVDLVNKFGSLEGFQILLERFTNGPPLSVPVIAALVKPFGQCAEILTAHTVQKYLMPVVDIVPKFLDGLTDDELKKESKTEAKNDALSSIVKALKQLVYRLPNQDEKIKSLEIFRLKMILRLLQISSFNGKMNALNEVNKVIANVSFHSSRHSQNEEDEWLTAEKMAEWIQENDVLSIVLRDSLHQPQYVEKLEKILRFMIKEKALSLQDLDRLWEAQSGKHDAIVKNVHDLLAKLAWDFSPEQLDHLFECFQGSWAHASKKQREKLLELIRRLAEDDKEGVMAHKVLGLLWNLAHSEDVPTDIMDQALAAHIKILDYSCSQDRDSQKMGWITKFVEELKNDKWVLPALKQIREICQLFPEAPQNFPHTANRVSHVYYRNSVISILQANHSIVMLVAQNLSAYMNKARTYAKDHPEVDPGNILPDGRFNHVVQVQERLKFLRFLLKDGQLWLCESQARQIWHCLAESAIYLTDREACFKWFAKLMGEEPDLDPEITKEFFEKNILQFDASLLTENGMNCFERFFKHVNMKENKLLQKRRGGYMMDDLELIGFDYLWRVVMWSPDEVAEKAITLLKDTFTNLGSRLQPSQMEIHEDFLQTTVDRLKALFDTVSILEKDKDSTNRVMQETTRMIRVLTVLKEYVAECDEAYGEERSILPLSRACRGKLVTLVVRFPNQGRQVDDIDIWSHTNDTIGTVRRHILHRVKATSNIKVDLYVNGEILEASEDKRLISQIPLRDKMLITAKLVQVGNSMPSSPDTSSDSSGGSPHHTYDGPNIEAENSLPGVLMSKNPRYAQFLFQLSDLGCSLQVSKLRDTARMLLKLMPADRTQVEKLQSMCAEHARSGTGVSQTLETMFFNSSPTQVLYNIEVAYSMLMPSIDPLSEDAFEFQYNFIRSGGVQLALNMLTKNNFLPTADLPTRRTAYVTVLKMCKLILTAVGYAKLQVVVDACSSEPRGPPVTAAEHSHAVVLQQALHHIPNHSTEFTTRNVAIRLGQQLAEQAISVLPDLNTIKAIQKIAWASGSGSLNLVHASNEEIHKAHEKPRDTPPDPEDLSVARESMEVLTVSLLLCPSATDSLLKDKAWHNFIIDNLQHCRHKPVRVSASEQFFLMATKCTSNPKPLVYFITLLFTVLSNLSKENARQSHEYFQLLCRLLNYACSTDVNFPNAEVLLNNEITWLKRVRDQVVSTGELQVEEALLEGHLGITRELLSFQSPEKKYHMGSEAGGTNLIRELVEDFVFPASKIVLQSRKLNGEFPTDHQAVPVCCSPASVIAAYDLQVALCTACVPNLKCLSAMLIDMYYNEPPLSEWEYLPPVGARLPKGFVGLKNAGATCYMNSVIQQLFMIEPVRTGILAVEGAADDVEEEYLAEEKGEGESNVDMCDEERKDEEKSVSNKDDERKEYDMGVLKQIQLIFGNLAASKLQYYVPRGFWKHFKLWGEPVNLREQHDALEFFNSLVDSVDEALKALGQPAILTKVLGGSFADQKICKDCPHRYQKEEPFTLLNVDIRNHQNLWESLEQYVKGDLLEGANAYHCEKCNRKVDTVKRLVIRKLPKILAIQLKRFDYDWERESAIKFNDYFEFPREFDMEPYTVHGLAKIEGEIIDADCDEKGQSTKYKLKGVVVHSGQASGGHYYSYILHRGEDRIPKWYKFDDGDVSECKMEDDEEMKSQCFGGEYLGEVFDPMLKRMAYRRQKRWWNAYILFYERVEEVDEEKVITKNIQDLTIVNRPGSIKMPKAIEKCVRKQNIMFMHEKTQFSPEYFQMMRKLLTCNQIYTLCQQDKLSPEAEQLAMLSTELASKFLFNVGFRTKKTLRGSANEWYEALTCSLRSSKNVRNWFAQNVMFSHAGRFAEYLLECPSSEVRSAFCKVVVCLAHFSLDDGPCPPPLLQGLYAGQSADPNSTLSDHLLVAVLQLLKKEVSEHGRHLQQYFHLFLMYSNLGVAEKQHLLKLNVPALFMTVALDEGPGPPIKYQYAELSKLFSVVSQLIRCCDVSSRCASSVQNQEVLPNPHGENVLMPIQPPVADILFGRTSYVKKVIEDCNNSEDTTKLLRYCCWENPHFSSTVLSELLWQVAYSYTYELRPYLDLLLNMLMLEDSWQNHRIHNALKGIPDDRDGLLDTIQRAKSHYQKRAYQCIKMMVSLFTHCAPAAQMLQNNGDLKRKWTWSVEWLNDELERRPYPGNTQYTYNNWSPPAQSNETSNGYFLERSQSARVTLAKAMELCPEEDPEDAELTDDQDMVPQGDEPVSPSGTTQDPQGSSQQSPPQGSGTSPQGSSSQSQQNMQQNVQNNQVTVDRASQPAHPNNQINNQLNTEEQMSTDAAETPADNPDTGEEERDQEESKSAAEEKEKETKPSTKSPVSGSESPASKAGTSKESPPGNGKPASGKDAPSGSKPASGKDSSSGTKPTNTKDGSPSSKPTGGKDTSPGSKPASGKDSGKDTSPGGKPTGGKDTSTAKSGDSPGTSKK